MRVLRNLSHRRIKQTNLRAASPTRISHHLIHVALADAKIAILLLILLPALPFGIGDKGTCAVDRFKQEFVDEAEIRTFLSRSNLVAFGIFAL
jgi:hypothetical protein